jgi:hypothetical protein
VRSPDLIALILNGELPKDTAGDMGIAMPSAKADENRREILAEVVGGVRGSSAPVPLEALAERAMRALGHEKTIGTSWAGAGTFRELLRQQLPAEVKLTSEPPYLAFDPKRHGEDGRATALEGREPGARQIASKPAALESMPLTAAALQQALPPSALPPTRPGTSIPPAGGCRWCRSSSSTAGRQLGCHPAVDHPHPGRLPGPAIGAARVPPAVRGMAKEISDNDLTVHRRWPTPSGPRARGSMRRDDVRFVLEVVSEADPWFEQGAPPTCSPAASAISWSHAAAARAPQPVGRRARPDRRVVCRRQLRNRRRRMRRRPPAPPKLTIRGWRHPHPRHRPPGTPGLARWWSSAGEPQGAGDARGSRAPSARRSRGFPPHVHAPQLEAARAPTAGHGLRPAPKADLKHPGWATSRGFRVLNALSLTTIPASRVMT